MRKYRTQTSTRCERSLVKIVLRYIFYGNTSHQKYHVPNEPFIEYIHFINLRFYWQFIAIFSRSSCHFSVSLNKNLKFTRALEQVDFFAEPIKLFDRIINFRRNRISQNNRKKRTHKHGLHSHQSIKDTSTESIREIELLSFWID